MKISTDTLRNINHFANGGLWTALFLSLVNISARAYCVGVTVTDGVLGIPRVTVALTPEGAIAFATSLSVVLLMGIAAIITTILVKRRRAKEAAEHDAP